MRVAQDTGRPRAACRQGAGRPMRLEDRSHTHPKQQMEKRPHSSHHCLYKPGVAPQYLLNLVHIDCRGRKRKGLGLARLARGAAQVRNAGWSGEQIAWAWACGVGVCACACACACACVCACECECGCGGRGGCRRDLWFVVPRLPADADPSSCRPPLTGRTRPGSSSSNARCASTASIRRQGC